MDRRETAPGGIGYAALASLALGALAGGALASALMGGEFSFHGRRVVVTGGSRGLGFLLALQLAQQGARVAILARDFAELAAARDEIARAGGEVYAVPCDVTHRGDVENAVQNVARRFGGIDVLINNAGTMEVGPLETMAVEDYEEAMAIHYWGPLYMTLAALPHLREGGEGRIVNIASIGGLVAVPHMAPYTGSKFALVGLSEGLGVELAPQGIAVTTVAPGPLRTGSHVNAYFKGQHEKEFAWFTGSMAVPGISTSARRAAHQIIEACRSGQPRLVIGLSARLLVALKSLAPSRTQQAVGVAGGMLPGDGGGGSMRQSGWSSRSALAPRGLTVLADKNIKRTMQHKAPQAP